MKKVVKFLRHWKIYSPGDIAGFEPVQADALIEGRAAEAYEEASPAAEPEKDPKAAAKTAK